MNFTMPFIEGSPRSIGAWPPERSTARGRFFTDEELAAGAATGDLSRKKKPEAAPAA